MGKCRYRVAFATPARFAIEFRDASADSDNPASAAARIASRFWAASDRW